MHSVVNYSANGFQEHFLIHLSLHRKSSKRFTLLLERYSKYSLMQPVRNDWEIGLSFTNVQNYRFSFFWNFLCSGAFKFCTTFSHNNSRDRWQKMDKRAMTIKVPSWNQSREVVSLEYFIMCVFPRSRRNMHAQAPLLHSKFIFSPHLVLFLEGFNLRGIKRRQFYKIKAFFHHLARCTVQLYPPFFDLLGAYKAFSCSILVLNVLQ